VLELLTIENIANLGVLIFLQVVLGFDNLLYISTESQRAPVRHQAAVRRWVILIAVLVAVDTIQSGYQKKLEKVRAHATGLAAFMLLLLKRNQMLFALNAPLVTGQAAIATNHAMAGNGNGNFIIGAGAGNRTCRSRFANALRDLGIRL